MSPLFEVYAIRLGKVDRPARDNFVHDPQRSGAMQLDFTMWLIRGENRLVAVDTGFSPEAGERRNRVLDRRPAEAVRELGLDPDDVTDLIVTHAHYDHAGNLGDFPQARIWIQEKELAYVAGPAMRHPQLSHFFEADDVCVLVQQCFRGRVVQVNGDATVTDGIEVFLVGGHTPGLQVVRVSTARGPVVLASDALHYFANLEGRNPFPAVIDVPQMLDGYERILGLAPGITHIIPGHDPEVTRRYAGPDRLPDGVVALHHVPQVTH